MSSVDQQHAVVVSSADAPRFWFLGTQMTLRATGSQTGGTFGLIEQVLPPGFAPPPHIHHAEDEAFLILEGRLVFTCGGERHDCPAGTMIFLPRSVRHEFRVEDGQPARLLQFNYPAGLEQFFVDLGEPVTDDDQPPAGQPDLAKLASLAAKYQIELLGPPPAN